MVDMTTADRQKRWRARQKGQGNKTLTVVLPAYLIEALHQVKKDKGITMSALVEDLLKAGFQTVTNNGELRRLPVRKRIRPKTTFTELLARIDAARSRGGEPPDQNEIAGVIRQMAKDHDIKKVKELLNEAGVPALSGKSRWTQAEIKSVLAKTPK